MTTPAYTTDLTTLEIARRTVASRPIPAPTASDFRVNPSLEILHLSWQCCRSATTPDGPPPTPGEEWAMIWREPGSGSLRTRPASPRELLALKLLAEGQEPTAAGAATGRTEAAMYALYRSVAHTGIVIGPASRIQRTEDQVPGAGDLPRKLRDVQVFTLQWHVTNRCDLHCRHCYDRSDGAPLATAEALDVLDDFAAFCQARQVLGHVSFSGGNPLLRPDFDTLYGHAAKLGFVTSILGNPTSRTRLEQLQNIQPIDFFQTSLEGLNAHNDYIRGDGHFDRVMVFLDRLRDMGIPSSIMLTLTRANMDQVLPLARHLEGRADNFTFNRLSPVGEGAALALPDPAAFRAFLIDYVDAAAELSVLGYKDNLLQPELEARGHIRFHGCTGYGCGAAFNFVALLPDGEVHACRKYPTPIGNVRAHNLATIYDGAATARHRRRPDACRTCARVAVCGGCPAITSGCGLNPATERDPFCAHGPAAVNVMKSRKGAKTATHE